MSILGNMLASGAYYKHARGEYAEAKKMYERAFEKGVTKPERFSTYGVLLMREGDFEGAIESFGKAIKMRPPQNVRIKTRLNRAMAYTKLGENEKAKAALEQIHEQFHSARAYETLGYFYVVTNDEKAEEYCLEAFDYDEDNYVILDNLCQLYLQKGDYEKARKYGEKAYEQEDFKVDVLRHMALIEAHDKNMDKAKEYCESMMEAPLTALNDTTEEMRLETYKNIMGKQYEPEENAI